jgi:hypothetical protein
VVGWRMGGGDGGVSVKGGLVVLINSCCPVL